MPLTICAYGTTEDKYRGCVLVVRYESLEDVILVADDVVVLS